MQRGIPLSDSTAGLAEGRRRHAEKVKEAIGVAVSMVPRGDIIALGHSLDGEITRIQRELAVGLELDRVNDQPATVKRSVKEFTRTLAEAARKTVSLEVFLKDFAGRLFSAMVERVSKVLPHAQ